jgi:aspartyl/asparaginyl-tRNA synthetase
MIDFKLLNESIDFYEAEGFKRVETPWAVSEEIDKITKPFSNLSFQLKHNDKCLVASGEQSFLYQYLKGFLPKGRFQTVTPCFRYENFDFLHTKYFLKNELIITDKVTDSTLYEVVQIALNFYRQYMPNAEVVGHKDGFDIEIHGKELGSYGIRECEFLKWIYATGCAEPRTSNLIKLYGISY